MTTKKIAPKSKKPATKPASYETIREQLKANKAKTPAAKPPALPSKPTPELTPVQVLRLKGGRNIDFSKRRFYDVELYESSYRDCDFTDTIMHNMTAKLSSFTNCSFIRTHVSYELFNRCSFSECDFSGIRANGAVFVGCSFESMTLSKAFPESAVFVGCSFESMTLSKAFLESAVFQSCHFDDCKLPDGVPISLQRLPTGQFTAYKSVRGGDALRSKLYVLELLVPRSAQRVIGLDALDSRSCDYGMCRVSKAKVVRVLDLDLKDITGLPSTPKVFRSRHDTSFTYEVGKWVKPDAFNPSPGTVCSSGIHIFMYPEQAVAY